MNSTNLILSESISSLIPLKKIKNTDIASDEKKKQFAKDFESVFISKLLDEMKNTIGDWGFEDEEKSEQVEGIFWLYLARDIAQNGGFGMWKDIYQSLTDSDQKNTSAEVLDKKL